MIVAIHVVIHVLQNHVAVKQDLALQDLVAHHHNVKQDILITTIAAINHYLHALACET